MCGRYGLYDFDDADIIKDNKGYSFKPNYNVAPTQSMPVITASDKGNKIEDMKWGIHRVVGPQIEKDIINTRADKAFGRFWGKNVRQFRCIIPANGFYEWKTVGKTKTPFWIHSKNSPLFMFAGIYSVNNDGSKQYSIMTTEPNKEMKNIHNRMPVILDRADERKWLLADDDDSIANFLHPFHDGGLEMYKVSAEVNKPGNNYKKLTEPLAA